MTEEPPDPNIPILEDSIAFSGPATPTWRGWIHAGTFPVATVLGAVLVAAADGSAAKASTAVFFATSLLLFGTSALYHRIGWSPRLKAVFRRIDHANIFLLIAGTYTPLAVLCLAPAQAAWLLSFAWGGALLGIGFRVFWLGAPRWLYVPLYLLLGWAAVMYLGEFFAANSAAMALIVAGGLCYTAGALCYALKRPNPFPGVFGFHEVFHLLTLLAFLCHWTGILLVAADPPAGL
ncbi:PAQR family membrane homeostasis protein TrhA [Arthrobacter mobilis]|uniref:Hemolysin III family protein n=1 Tax=Arthrobacter mobilis TaxID=2724944 RepID=A0A7X6HGT2_9MICC|nr:hemolysin III family protein [Arthrobacter mobilis]NKX55761.1 hemolysin III family protein [Arthrobacter mobilis]